MADERPGPDIEVAQYGAVLRRRWWVVAVGVLGGLLLAVVALLVLPKSYTATASVLVAPTSSDATVAGERTSSEVNLDTEAQIVTSGEVAAGAAEILGGAPSTMDLAEAVTVEVPANTSVLNIAFTAGSATEAKDGADAFADAYLSNRGALAASAVEGRRAAIGDRVEVLQADLQEVNATLGESDGGGDRASAQSRRDLLLQQISSLNAELGSIEGSASDPGTMLNDAQEPESPSSPDPLPLLLSGLMAGLLLGVMVALVVDRNDRRVRDRTDLERLGLDVLVGRFTVPRPHHIAGTSDQSADAESLRMLRNALLAQLPQHRGSLMVAPISRADEGSAVALNLAATFARSGLDVVLVSAGSYEGRSGSEVPVGVGLAEVLQQRIRYDHVLAPVDGVPGLRVMGPGQDASLYSQLVQSEEAKRLFTTLAGETDVLVIEVAPMTLNADAQSLATEFDGVVLVATVLKTTSTELLEAVDQLRHVKARVFGAVVVEQAEKPSGRPMAIESRRDADEVTDGDGVGGAAQGDVGADDTVHGDAQAGDSGSRPDEDQDQDQDDDGDADEPARAERAGGPVVVKRRTRRRG